MARPQDPDMSSFGDIAGAAEAKRLLREVLLLPTLFPPSTFRGVRKLPSTILLHGPPGTGKTLLVRTLARALSCPLVCVTPSSVLSKWAGESEKALRRAFQHAATGREPDGETGADSSDEEDEGAQRMKRRKRSRNRSRSPCRREHGRDRETPAQPSAHKSGGQDQTVTTGILFLDEVDALAPRRDGALGGSDLGARRLLNELLLLMSAHAHEEDGESEGRRVLIIACTNRVEDIDPALLRRFDRRVYVGLPDCQSRAHLLRTLLQGVEHDIECVSVEEVAALTEGWSGADLTSLVAEAALGPIRHALDGHTQEVERTRVSAPLSWVLTPAPAPAGATPTIITEIQNPWDDGNVEQSRYQSPTHSCRRRLFHPAPAPRPYLTVRPVCIGDLWAAMASTQPAHAAQAGGRPHDEDSGSRSGVESGSDLSTYSNASVASHPAGLPMPMHACDQAMHAMHALHAAMVHVGTALLHSASMLQGGSHSPDGGDKIEGDALDNMPAYENGSAEAEAAYDLALDDPVLSRRRGSPMSG